MPAIASVSVHSIALALSITCLTASASAREGNWHLDIVTTVGKCEKHLQAGFAVRNDDVLPDPKSPLRADGAIDPNGSMWARLTQAKDLYRMQGKLGSRTGSGTWSSNTRLCGGSWKASR